MGGRERPCWVCGGAGQADLYEEGALSDCEMCRGTGIVDAVPTSTGEMVAMLASLPSIPWRTLTDEDLVRVAEIERIVVDCLRDMEMEETSMATCTWCKTGGVTLRRCEKCGNIWHCSKKPGRETTSINRCEQCGAVDKITLIR